MHKLKTYANLPYRKACILSHFIGSFVVLVYNQYFLDFDEPPCSKRRKKSSDNEDSCNNDSSDDENKRLCAEYEDDDDDDPVTRFRRGEGLPDDLDLGDDSQDSVEKLEAEDMEDEREWNAMGAALEREFLS